jgi:hypothetical protein
MPNEMMSAIESNSTPNSLVVLVRRARSGRREHVEHDREADERRRGGVLPRMA